MRNFDFIPFVRPPRISASTGMVLSTRLLRAAQDQPIPEVVVGMLKRIRTAGERLREAMIARDRSAQSLRRPVDRRFDAAWGGCYRTLDAWIPLQGEPEAARAQALKTRLFPGGLQFLAGSYEAEWVHSGQLIEVIADEGLEADLVELVGARKWALVLDAHAKLGEALGLVGEVEASAPSVGEEVRALAMAISDYGRVFAGTVMSDEDLDLFEDLMRPLADLRAQQRSSGPRNPQGEGEGDLFDADEASVDLDLPLPEVDAAPVAA